MKRVKFLSWLILCNCIVYKAKCQTLDSNLFKNPSYNACFQTGADTIWLNDSMVNEVLQAKLGESLSPVWNLGMGLQFTCIMQVNTSDVITRAFNSNSNFILHTETATNPATAKFPYNWFLSGRQCAEVYQLKVNNSKMYFLKGSRDNWISK